MHFGYTGICRAGVEVVGVQAPAMNLTQVDISCGIIRPEDNPIFNNIIGRVEWIVWELAQKRAPKCHRTLIAIKHTSTICVWISPISSS